MLDYFPLLWQHINVVRCCIKTMTCIPPWNFSAIIKLNFLLWSFKPFKIAELYSFLCWMCQFLIGLFSFFSLLMGSFTCFNISLDLILRFRAKNYQILWKNPSNATRHYSLNYSATAERKTVQQLQIKTHFYMGNLHAHKNWTCINYKLQLSNFISNDIISIWPLLWCWIFWSVMCFFFFNFHYDL